MNFSNKHRQKFKDKLANEQFDLLVVGGGITGCGIALDAALRGMKVALVEKDDFASGTSSRSTKLIHGGLRYLKQLEFKLVHDVGTERATVHRLARHVVIPEKMLLPIYKDGTLGSLTTSMALLVYDLLAGVKSDERRKMLSVSDTLRHEPLLHTNGLEGSGLYFEYRTDDARLVIENAKSAHAAGAVLLNYTEVKEFTYDSSGSVTGALVHDKTTGELLQVKSQVTVNAAGPWVDLLRKADKSLQGKRLQLTKGVHLVFPFDKLPLRQAAYFDVGDGRMIFAIPRDGITYVGTTDTVYNQDIDHPVCTKADAEYLLAAVNRLFTGVHLTLKDIVSTWAGLRPLIQEDGKAPGELSRKDEIFESKSGLLSIAGGKLTGYRLMAEKIVDLTQEKLKKKFAPCTTSSHYLSGGHFDSDKDFEKALLSIISSTGSFMDESLVRSWFFRYGTNTPKVIEYYKEQTVAGTASHLCALYAELQYSVEHEMVLQASDFFVRRSGSIFFARESSEAMLAEAQQFLALNLSLTEEQSEKSLEEVRQQYADAVAIKIL